MATALLINAVLVLAAALGLSWASVLLGPRRRLAGDEGLPYETGMPPLSAEPPDRMWVSYHRFAVLFVVLDVDLAFLAPWVLLRDQLTREAMIAMTVFILLVGFTLAYVWRKGALECR